MYEKRNSVYCYKGTDILVNKLDIKNKELLKEYERQIVAIKLLELEKQPIVNCTPNVKHFCLTFGVQFISGGFLTQKTLQINF